MVEVFENVAEQIRGEITDRSVNQEAIVLLRSLGHRAHRVLGWFSTQETITTAKVTSLLGISSWHTRDLVVGWANEGWLEVANPSKRSSGYELSAAYKMLLDI